MAVTWSAPRRTAEPEIPAATNPCTCKGCRNLVPFSGMVCHECFLYCDDRRKSDGHRLRKLRIGGVR